MSRRKAVPTKTVGTTATSASDKGIAATVAAHERHANETGRHDWLLYASHRDHLTTLLTACAPSGGRVALLGAGNCNDVDLSALLSHFAEVHLVDIDRESVIGAQARLDENSRARVVVHAPVDLSGLLAQWRLARDRTLTFSQIDEWPALGAQNVLAALPPSFDLAASCCLLTQMSWGLTQSLGEGHAAETQARQALVAAHLRSLCALATGGTALLVCDMISTEYYPLDDLPPGADLKELMERLIGEQNYYKGANPVMVRRLLRSDPVLSQSVKKSEWLQPWLWKGPLQRTYLVYAVQLSC